MEDLTMFFLQQGPAETTSYMVAGYTVIFGVMLVYLVSLLVRSQRKALDLKMLEEIEEQDSQNDS